MKLIPSFTWNWNKTIVANCIDNINPDVFTWLVPGIVRSMWSPIPEIWIICSIVFQSTIIYYGILLGGEFQSLYNSKEYPVDIALLYSIDVTFDTNFGQPYIDKYYPYIPPIRAQ